MLEVAGFTQSPRGRGGSQETAETVDPAPDSLGLQRAGCSQSTPGGVWGGGGEGKVRLKFRGQTFICRLGHGEAGAGDGGPGVCVWGPLAGQRALGVPIPVPSGPAS